jgi:hypothetical protein
MDKNGLKNDIFTAGLYIANGRKSVYVRGEAWAKVKLKEFYNG